MTDYNHQLIELLNEKIRRLEQGKMALTKEVSRLKRENRELRKTFKQ